MRVAGIVSEFNPFHNGHQYLLDRIRENGAACIVAVMSGDFVQRGEAAFADKFLRAEAAVRCGVDLVVDLPAPWSLGGAQTFARGGVGLLGALGCDTLAFGCETPDTVFLEKTARLLENTDIQTPTADGMRSGLTYPAALRRALAMHGEEACAALLNQPNNVLAVEYIKALHSQNHDMAPFAVQRIGQAHDAPLTHDTVQSAAAIRALKDFGEAKRLMPSASYAVYNDHPGRLLSPDAYETAVLTALRLLPQDAFDAFVDDRSGLRDRLRSAVRSSVSLDALYQAAKTKSVTHAKVRRAVMHLFLQIPTRMADGEPPYLRVLAANERGLALLGTRPPALPVVTKHAETATLHEPCQQLYAVQCRASDLYVLCTKEKRACGLEQTSSIQIIPLAAQAQPHLSHP